MSDSSDKPKPKKGGLGDGPMFRRPEQRTRVYSKTDGHCPGCDKEFERLGQHWRYQDHRGICEYPTLTERQRDVITGLLMGDATVDGVGDDDINPHLVVYNKNPYFQEWVWQELEGIRSRVSGSDDRLWSVRTWSLPCLQEFADWYSSGQKRFPKGLDLTPLIANIWYCCDGSLGYSGYYHTDASAMISSVNERDRAEYLRKLFIDAPFTVSIGSNGEIVPSDTSKFLNWIGDPLPGYEYKWAYQDIDRYRNLKSKNDRFGQ